MMRFLSFIVPKVIGRNTCGKSGPDSAPAFPAGSSVIPVIAVSVAR